LRPFIALFVVGITATLCSSNNNNTIFWRNYARPKEDLASLSTDDDAKNSTLQAANEELERQLKGIQADFDIKQSEAANNLASFEAERNHFSQNNYSLQTELESQ
jgi:hypothetical protein